MKQSEKLWIQNLVRVSVGKTISHSNAQQFIHYSIQVFLEELCSLMLQYTQYYNELIVDSNPEEIVHIFQTQQPHPGLIILKKGDKMIISVSGKIIRVRKVQTHLNNDRNFQSYDFEPKQNEQGCVFWRCINDGQPVNPELVAQNYLSSFLISGCTTLPQTLRLVVSTHP